MLYHWQEKYIFCLLDVGIYPGKVRKFGLINNSHIISTDKDWNERVKLKTIDSSQIFYLILSYKSLMINVKIIDVCTLGYTFDVQLFYFLLVISKYVMQRIRTRVAKLKHTCIKCVYKSSFEVLLHVILFLRWKETKTVRLFPTWFKHICLIICNYFLIRMLKLMWSTNSYIRQWYFNIT